MPPVNWYLLHNGYVLVIASLLACGGLVVTCVGLVVLRFAPVRGGLLPTFRQRWGLGPGVDDETLRGALRVLTRIRAWSLIFAGAGMTLVVVVDLAVVWLTTGDFLLVTIFHGWALALPTFIAAFLLGCAGQAYGVLRLRARARNHPAQGDLRPRRVRDYVPAWVGVAFGAWAVAAVLLTLVALPIANVPLRTELVGGQWVYLPLGRWALLATPALMATCLALGIALLRWMVALPRLQSTDGLADVGVFDMLFRRESIIAILLQGAQLMFFLSIMQWAIALDDLPRGMASVIMGIVGLAIFVTYLAVSLALGTFARSGVASAPPRRGNATVMP